MSQHLIILSYYSTIYIITTAPIFLFLIFFAEFVTMKCPLLDISALTTCCALICCHVHRPPAARFTKRLFTYLCLCCFVQHLPSKRRAAARLTSKMASGEVPRVIMKCECDLFWSSFVSLAKSRLRGICSSSLYVGSLQSLRMQHACVLVCSCWICNNSCPGLRKCVSLFQKWWRFTKESNRRHPWSLTSG